MAIRIAIIGFGKIARDQHAPVIAADPRFQLAAVINRSADPEIGVPHFRSHQEMFEALPGEIDALAICTPPNVRHAIAREAMDAGIHVLLEKPPAATLGEVEHLISLARTSGRTLFAAWHAQHNKAVEDAARLLRDTRISALDISWLEDVRKWHPGQEWIWQPGGFGVFDPGINALSIATRILPMPLFVASADLLYPANKQAPIAASLTFVGDAGPLRAEMDWRFEEGEQWTIRVETEDGWRIELRDGGGSLYVDGEKKGADGPGEYASIYERFANLIERQESDVDREPLRIVADAFMVGRRELVEPF